MSEDAPSPSTFTNKRRVRFTQIGNSALLDARLSMGAKGLLAIMLSRPDDWTYRMSWLQAQATDSLYAVRRMLKELLDTGYVVRQPLRVDGGRVAGWEYAVSDDPADLATVFTNFRKTVAPSDGEPHATNTDSTKTDKYQDEREGAENRRADPGPVSSQDSDGPEQPPHPVQESVETRGKASQSGRAKSLEKVPGAAAGRGAAAEVPVPASLLAVAGFENAWREWVAFRKQRGLSRLPVTMQRQLKMLAAHADPVAVLNYSLDGGYSGLFPERFIAAGRQHKGRPRTTEDANQRAIDTANAVYRAITEDSNDTPF